MTRERAPFRDDIDLEDLSYKEWKRYATICGECLAHAHALSDETGLLPRDVEPRILDAIGSTRLFVDDISRFTKECVHRLQKDHEAFKKDHALGAFDHVDVAYE